jgi:hypothetical protein
MAVAGLLASSGFAMADTTDVRNASLSLDPTVITAQASATPAANDSLLMSTLDRAGAARPLSDLGLKLYGWVEGGYTYNHRHHGDTLIIPGPFNHEYGNHFMLNQLVLRFERGVDATKFDVGGMVELMYGSDAARIHSTGLGYNGSDATDDGSPSDPLAVANLHPIWQFDIPQAYIDVNIPIGNGLKVRAGKFVTLLGYETIDPRTNPFYSHSYLFGLVPFTHTGVLGMYQISDQFSVTAGVTRGWDIALEDTNGCAIDVIGQFAYTPNKQLAFYLNYSVGPENAGDTGHYRTAIDPVITWQVTDQLKLGAEGLYIYDGGINAGLGDNDSTHAYGDAWGLALYASYRVNDYVTVNGRVEKAHTYLGNFANSALVSQGQGDITGLFGGIVPTLNAYEATLGVTITPLPQDPIGKNLSIRPEIRYDWSEDSLYPTGGRTFKDQLTFGADVIFTF